MERVSPGGTVRPNPIGRERTLILGLLLVLAAAAWIVVIAQRTEMTDATMMGATMGLAAPLFLAIWVVMMVAMMFPTAAPMILTFAQITATKRKGGHVFVPTWVFVGAYLLVWTAIGAVAYGVAMGIGMLTGEWMWFQDNAPRLGGLVLVLAGLYQLSPLKYACLAKCRTPMAFILTSWRDGYPGAIRMGLEHGAYCLGCCWLLFAILFPLGLMNVAAMALVTLVIFAEKSLPMGIWVGRLAAIALIAAGSSVIAVPSLLPTAM